MANPDTTSPTASGADDQPTRIEARRSMPVSASTVFDILTTPDGHVEIDSSGMLMSAEGDRVRGVGDSFVVHMDREALGDIDLGEYDVQPTFVGWERDRYVEWKIVSQLDPPFGHTFGYEIEADPDRPGRILVTSFCDWSNMHPNYVGLVPMPIISQTALRATLGILDRVARRREAAADAHRVA